MVRRQKSSGATPAQSAEATPSGFKDDDDYPDGSELRRLIPGRRLKLIPHTVDPKRVFRFEFGPAVLAQVREQLEILPIIPLESSEATDADYPGFYQLLWQQKSQYIGRTIRPIGARLREHITKLRGRIPLEEIGCRFLFVEDLSLVGLSEDSLINYFHPRGMDEWGKQGFGSKVTGHGRADQVSAWHVAYPPDLSWLITTSGKSRLLRTHVAEIARGAPVTVSVPKKFKPRFATDFPEPMEFMAETRTFSEWITDLEHILQPNWIVDRKPMAWYIVPANDEAQLEADSES